VLLKKRRRRDQDERPDRRRRRLRDIEEDDWKSDSGAPEIDFEDDLMEDGLSFEEFEDESVN
jgi:hypothetical protein